jgi:hypothetical protein
MRNTTAYANPSTLVSTDWVNQATFTSLALDSASEPSFSAVAAVALAAAPAGTFTAPNYRRPSCADRHRPDARAVEDWPDQVAITASCSFRCQLDRNTDAQAGYRDSAR